jgi:hypothetical protein
MLVWNTMESASAELPSGALKLTSRTATTLALETRARLVEATTLSQSTKILHSQLLTTQPFKTTNRWAAIPKVPLADRWFGDRTKFPRLV